MLFCLAPWHELTSTLTPKGHNKVMQIQKPICSLKLNFRAIVNLLLTYRKWYAIVYNLSFYCIKSDLQVLFFANLQYWIRVLRIYYEWYEMPSYCTQLGLLYHLWINIWMLKSWHSVVHPWLSSRLKPSTSVSRWQYWQMLHTKCLCRGLLEDWPFPHPPSHKPLHDKHSTCICQCCHLLGPGESLSCDDGYGSTAESRDIDLQMCVWYTRGNWCLVACIVGQLHTLENQTQWSGWFLSLCIGSRPCNGDWSTMETTWQHYHKSTSKFMSWC